MKNKSILLGALILGASVFAIGKASAFPLYLSSASGTISYTPTYSNLSTSNATHVSTVAVNLKTIMTVVSNQVFINDATIVPKDAMVAYDPFANSTYLTNTTGFNHSLSGIVSVSLSEIATSFRKSNSGTNEVDKILVSLRVRGTAPDGSYFEFNVQGSGTLEFSVGKNDNGSMTISMPHGARYGAFKGSDDGVTSGGFIFRGKGTPEWAGAFATWWF